MRDGRAPWRAFAAPSTWPLPSVLLSVVGQGLEPGRMSPCRRCAGSELFATRIRTYGGFFLPVRWQIVTFCTGGFGLVVVVVLVVVDGVVVVVVDGVVVVVVDGVVVVVVVVVDVLVDVDVDVLVEVLVDVLVDVLVEVVVDVDELVDVVVVVEQYWYCATPVQYW
jgi:hypothetical protein